MLITFTSHPSAVKRDSPEKLVRARAGRPTRPLPKALRATSAMCAARRRRGRTVRRCHVTWPRCAKRPSRLGAGIVAAFARTASRKRYAIWQRLAPLRHAIRRSSQAECRPRTSRSNRRARCARIQGKLAQPIERSEWLRPAVVPRPVEHNREPLESAQCDISEKFIAITEMAIGRSRAHARPPGGLGKGEACRSFLRDQFQGGAQQRLFQVAVVVTARATPLVFRPAHVNGFYMSPRVTSMSPLGIVPVTGIRRMLVIWLPKPRIRSTASAADSITTDI